MEFVLNNTNEVFCVVFIVPSKLTVRSVLNSIDYIWRAIFIVSVSELKVGVDLSVTWRFGYVFVYSCVFVCFTHIIKGFFCTNVFTGFLFCVFRHPFLIFKIRIVVFCGTYVPFWPKLCVCTTFFSWWWTMYTSFSARLSCFIFGGFWF